MHFIISLWIFDVLTNHHLSLTIFEKDNYFDNYYGKVHCFKAFHEIQFQSHFMKHKILLWNIFIYYLGFIAYVSNQ